MHKSWIPRSISLKLRPRSPQESLRWNGENRCVCLVLVGRLSATSHVLRPSQTYNWGRVSGIRIRRWNTSHARDPEPARSSQSSGALRKSGSRTGWKGGALSRRRSVCCGRASHCRYCVDFPSLKTPFLDSPVPSLLEGAADQQLLERRLGHLLSPLAFQDCRGFAFWPATHRATAMPVHAQVKNAPDLSARLQAAFLVSVYKQVSPGTQGLLQVIHLAHLQRAYSEERQYFLSP